MSCTVWKAAGEIEEGLLSCACGEAFPIIGGIPWLLLGPLRRQLRQDYPAFFAAHDGKLPDDLRPAGRAGSPDSQPAARTQKSFGFEWTTFADVRPEWERNVWGYLAPLTAASFQGKVVLDAGCGMGRHLHYTGQHSVEAIGVDFSRAGDAVQESGVPGLRVLPCGPLPPNPAELLTTPRFQELLDCLRERYDFVLLDTPPLLAVTDPAVVAPRVDGVLLTVRVSRHGRPQAERAKGRLEYDFLVRPGADPSNIRLGFAGADRAEVDAQGDLVLHNGAGAIRQHRPFLYQEVDGGRREVTGRYVLDDAQQVGFAVGAYDRSRPLVIDPVLTYSTYLGGTGNDQAFAVAVDAAGNAYVAGSTTSLDFPTVNPLQPGYGGGLDAFVAKLDPTGSSLRAASWPLTWGPMPLGSPPGRKSPPCAISPSGIGGKR